MLLVTSVPPVFSRKDPRTGEEVGLRYLASCISSWRKNGFRPISINRSDEEDAINALGLIDCRAVSNANARFPNRFGPSLGAIFDVVPPDEPVVIVNADVYMLSSAGCAEFLWQRSQNSVVAARRIDVSHHGASRGEIFGLGYDLVAFTPAKIPKTVSNARIRRFQLGAPWWDYAFPYCCTEELPAFRIKEPFLTHLLHPDRWDNGVWNELAVVAREACPSIENDEIRKAAGTADEAPAIGLAFIEALFGSRFAEIGLPPFRADAVYQSRPLAIDNIPKFRRVSAEQFRSRDWDFQSLFENVLGNTKEPAPGKRDPIGRKIRRTIKKAVFMRSQIG